MIQVLSRSSEASNERNSSTLVAEVKGWWQRRILKRRKKQADSLRESTNLQHYVLKLNGKIRILSARRIRLMRKNGLLDKSLTWKKLNEIALYKTR